MTIFLKKFGWIFLGIFLQFKFNVLYGIVFLENLNFHDRSYFVKMKMTPTNESLRILTIETTVHHSLGSNYFANVYIPNGFNVLNQDIYPAAEPIEGYKSYKMDMKRKYRDVLSRKDFLIVPSDQGNIPLIPVVIRFENLDQMLHKDNTYQLASSKRNIILQGPEITEAKYKQQWGM
tara:strand:+ start:314 stop:844 length:531 start_codon:yes stop_codon:yes gene_type:complete